MPNQKNVPARSTSTQQHRTTLGARLRVLDANGRIVPLQPLADVLSPATIATLVALQKIGGRQ